MFVRLLFYTMAFCLYINATEIPLKLCDPNAPKTEYRVPRPKICKRQNLDKVLTCKAKIHEVTSSITPIRVYICKKTVTTWQTTKWFFGAETQKIETKIANPPSPLFCQEWVQAKTADVVGDFSLTDDQVWATDNHPKLVFKWPTSMEGQVFNGFIQETKIFYDHTKNVLTGPVPSIATCNVHKGFCKLGSEILIWNTPNLIDCPVVSTIEDVMLLHFNSSNDLHRIELKDLGSSFHNWDKYESVSHKCFGKETYNTNNGVLITPENCTYLSKTDYFKERHSNLNYHLKPNSGGSSTIIGFIQESTDNMAEIVANLTSDIHFLECQLENMLGNIYSILSRQFPGQILQGILGGYRAGITVGDVITELICVDIKATVLRSLEFNGTYSTRPLVSYIKNNETKYAQIYGDGNAYPGIHLKENFVQGRIFTFLIGDKYYSYQNYTIAHNNMHVQNLRPKLKSINESFTPLNYASIFEHLPRHIQGYEDINSILLTLNQGDVIQNKISNDLNIQEYEREQVDASVPITVAQNEVRDSFVNALSYISSPILTVIYIVLFHLALIWAAVFPCIFVKRMIPMFRTGMHANLHRYRMWRQNQVNNNRNDEIEMNALNNNRPEQTNAISPIYPYLPQ